MSDSSSRRLYRRAYSLSAEGWAGRASIWFLRTNWLAHFHLLLGESARCRPGAVATTQRSAVHVIIHRPALFECSSRKQTFPVQIVLGMRNLSPRPITPMSQALAAKHRGLWRFYVLFVRRQDRGIPLLRQGKNGALLGTPIRSSTINPDD